MIYIAGFPEYSRACTEAVENDYRGFVRSGVKEKQLT